jgi:NAD(P)H dehydrogenase (quinone)
MSIVVTGATGQLGRLVIADLLASGVPAAGITAVVRSREKAADLAAQGVTLVVADYDEPESLAGVFGPADRLLLISGSEVGKRIAQHKAVIDAAAAAGVAQLAYTGAFGGPANPMLLAEEHKATEQLILDSGLPYTFLRNSWYSEVYFQSFGAVLEHGAVVNGVASGARIATATRADYAAAAAVVVSTDGHLNQVYELSGDTAWTFEEFAAEVSRQTGRTVVHQTLGAEENKQFLVSVGLPEGFAAILADVDVAVGNGALAGTPGDLSRLTGRPTTPIGETIAEAVKSA